MKTVRIYFKRDDGTVYHTIVRTVPEHVALHLGRIYRNQATIRIRPAQRGDLRRDARRWARIQHKSEAA